MAVRVEGSPRYLIHFVEFVFNDGSIVLQSLRTGKRVAYSIEGGRVKSLVEDESLTNGEFVEFTKWKGLVDGS